MKVLLNLAKLIQEQNNQNLEKLRSELVDIIGDFVEQGVLRNNKFIVNAAMAMYWMLDRIHFTTILAKYNIVDKDLSTKSIKAVMFELFGNESWYISAGMVLDGSMAVAANHWIVKSDLFDLAVNGGIYYKSSKDKGAFVGFEIRF